MLGIFCCCSCLRRLQQAANATLLAALFSGIPAIRKPACRACRVPLPGLHLNTAYRPFFGVPFFGDPLDLISAIAHESVPVLMNLYLPFSAATKAGM